MAHWVFRVFAGTIFALQACVSDKPVSAFDAAEIERFSEVGLGKQENVLRLAEALCEIDVDLSPDDLLDEVRGALSAVVEPSMPTPRIIFDQSIPGFGNFLSTDWTIRIKDNHHIKEDGKYSMKKLAPKIGHELRHAEQYYMVARYQGAVGVAPTDKGSYMFLPEKIIKIAISDPSEPGHQEFEFGKYIYIKSLDKRIRDKKKFLKEKLTSKGSDYKKYLGQYNSELPREVDAHAMEQALGVAIAQCLSED